MGRIARVILALAIAVAASAVSARAQEKFSTLKAGDQAFTNVVVLDKTATHLFIQHSAGTASVKLKDLDPELRKKFGYDAVKAAEIEQGNKAYVPPSETLTRAYAVPDSGTLRFTFSKAWKDSYANTPGGLANSRTIRFEIPGNPDFLVLISTIPGGGRLADADITRTLELNGQRFVANSVEQKVIVTSFRGPETVGGYYSLTDRNLADRTPPPDDFRYQTQGVAKIGSTAFSFTIFSNQPETRDQKAALEMVKAAQFIEKPAP